MLADSFLAVDRDDPRVASEALTGRIPARNFSGAALFSNEASRIVDPYGLADWPEALELLRTGGPREIIHRVRAAEADGWPGSTQGSGTTPPDDATVAHCRLRRADRPGL
jgi:hypothetical protein